MTTRSDRFWRWARSPPTRIATGFSREEVLGRDAREAESRRPIGYLPENHRFPAYMTGAGMLDFFGALSGMDRRDRRKRIPELLAAVGLDE